MLAKDYGWSPREIYEEVAFDDAIVWMEMARKANINERIMQVMIAHNPHLKEPGKLIDKLKEDLNGDMFDSEPDEEEIKANLKRLKQLFGERRPNTS